MRTRTSARLGALAASIAAIALLSACSTTAAKPAASADSGKPVKITFWDDNGGTRTAVYQKLIKDFEQQNPNITVDYVGIPASDAVNKLQTAVAGGSVPDVAITEDYNIGSLAAQNALSPLDSLLAHSSLKGKIAADALTAARGAAFDDKLYYLPFTVTTATMWYNDAAFKAAGVAVPESWSDFFTAADKLTDPAQGKYGFALRGAAGSVNQLVDVVIGCGELGSLYTKKGVSTVDDSKAVDCIQQYADLYKTATPAADLNNAYQQMVTEFDGGTAASMLHNLGSATTNQQALGADNALGEALPKASDGKRYLPAGSTGGPVIFKASKHQDADWKWASFLLSHSADSYWNQQAGQLPTNLAARDDAWVKANQPIKNAIDSLAEKDAVTVTLPLYLPNWQTILSGMEPDFQSVLLKQETAKQFAAKWADQLTKAQSDYKSHFGKSK